MNDNRIARHNGHLIVTAWQPKRESLCRCPELYVTASLFQADGKPGELLFDHQRDGRRGRKLKINPFLAELTPCHNILKAL